MIVVPFEECRIGIKPDRRANRGLLELGEIITGLRPPAARTMAAAASHREKRKPARQRHTKHKGQATAHQRSIDKRIAHQNRVLTLGRGADQRHRGFDQFLHPLDIFDRLGWQIGP